MNRYLLLCALVLGCLLAAALSGAGPTAVTEARQANADLIALLPAGFVRETMAVENMTGADWWVDGDQGTSYMGWGTSWAGDTNNDGYDEIIVGAIYYDSGMYRSGRAWLFFGSEDGLELTPRIFNPPVLNSNGFFGASVGTAGDVNGDEYDDLIIGMTNYESSGATPDEGAVFVYYGGEDGPDTTPDWQAEGEMTYAHLGDVVGWAGDVNDDGYDDVIAGAYYYNSNYGGYFAWYGSETGLGATGTPANADWKVFGDQFGGSLNVVGTAGDVNGDGYDDVITGAVDYDKGQDGEGLVAVWYGSENGLGTETTLASADWTAQGEAAGRRLGDSIGALGDVNGDGYDDIVIGSYKVWQSEIDGGDLLVYYGSASGLGDPATPADADWHVVDAPGGDQLSFSVQRHPADVNGDGYDDLIAGVNGYDVISGTMAVSETLSGAGAVMVWYGSASGLAGDGTVGSANWVAYGQRAGGYMGRFLDTAGDVDGNGLADIVAAAPYYNNDVTSGSGEGRIYAFYSPWRVHLPLLSAD